MWIYYTSLLCEHQIQHCCQLGGWHGDGHPPSDVDVSISPSPADEYSGSSRDVERARRGDIGFHFRVPGFETPRKPSLVEPQEPGLLQQVRRIEPGLVGKDRIVHRPEQPLLARTLGGFCGGHGLGVNLRQWKVPERNLHLAGLDISRPDIGQRRLRETVRRTGTRSLRTR